MYVTPKVSVVEHGLSNVCFVRKPSLITDNNYLTKPFLFTCLFFFLLRIILIESRKVEATIPQTEQQDFRFSQSYLLRNRTVTTTELFFPRRLRVRSDRRKSQSHISKQHNLVTHETVVKFSLHLFQYDFELTR